MAASIGYILSQRPTSAPMVISVATVLTMVINGHQLVPWGHRYADGEQQRMGDSGGEKLIDGETTLLQMRRDCVGQLGKNGKEQHGDRRRETEQAVAHDAQEIKRYCRETRGCDSAHIDRCARLVF